MYSGWLIVPNYLLDLDLGLYYMLGEAATKRQVAEKSFFIFILL